MTIDAVLIMCIDRSVYKPDPIRLSLLDAGLVARSNNFSTIVIYVLTVNQPIIEGGFLSLVLSHGEFGVRCYMGPVPKKHMAKVSVITCRGGAVDLDTSLNVVRLIPMRIRTMMLTMDTIPGLKAKVRMIPACTVLGRLPSVCRRVPGLSAVSEGIC